MTGWPLRDEQRARKPRRPLARGLGYLTLNPAPRLRQFRERISPTGVARSRWCPDCEAGHGQACNPHVIGWWQIYPGPPRDQVHVARLPADAR